MKTANSTTYNLSARIAMYLGTAIVAIALLFAFSALLSEPAQAINVIEDTDGKYFKQTKSENIENSGVIENITNILLFAIGVIAVIVIIIGGIKYTTSNGDASRTKSAKDTILYAVVGLVFAIMAWGIVSFVVGRF